MNSNSTHILIADDHHLVAESLSLLLSSVEGVTIVGIVNNGWQALNFIEKKYTDIILADYHMPLLNGIELTTKIKEKGLDVKVIMLTMNEDATLIKNAIQAGVFGYVMKSAEKPELVTAIKTVANGERYFSGQIIKKLAEIPSEDSINGKTQLSDIRSLTRREIEVLKLIANDLSNIEIAEHLCVSLTTVETHRRNLMKKVGVNSVLGLVKWGLSNGIIEKL